MDILFKSGHIQVIFTYICCFLEDIFDETYYRNVIRENVTAWFL